MNRFDKLVDNIEKQFLSALQKLLQLAGRADSYTQAKIVALFFALW